MKLYLRICSVPMKAFSPVRTSLAVQFTVAMLVSLFALMFGQIEAKSVLLGALVFVVPNLYFTYYVFRYRGSDIAASEWLRGSFMRGHMGKLTLSIAGFAVVFRLLQPLNEVALFAGYSLMIFTQWWLGKRLADIVAD